MTEDSQGALQRALRVRLIGSSTEVWGNQVYADLKPPTPGIETVYPYAVFAYSAGGELNARRALDAEYVYTVRVVSNDRASAFTGAGRITALLNDADTSTTNVMSTTDWYFLTCTQERKLWLVELIDGQQIFHSGGYFRIRMEAK